MGLMSWPVFRSGIFKNIKYLFSPAQRVQRVLYASEMGVLSMESLPMAIGFMSKTADYLSWLVVHKLKVTVAETGESILIVTERSYLPVDPFGEFTDEDKVKLQPLDELALSRYDAECTRISDENLKGLNTSIYHTIVVGCICIILLIVVFSLKK